MTPRAEAWLRQAQSDLDAARCMAAEAFHVQACYLAGQAAEKALEALLVAAGITPPYSHSLERFVELLQTQGLNTQALTVLRLKPLTRMNSDSLYPQGDEAPADLFDANDSAAALSTAEAVLRIATAELRS
ncbi:HEPN domain-containing protein [Cyanobium sp. ATX 6A2]|uniref:HEPN domain-containing protein n=1 Tax=Cyanobium sp. ATX 6A2 TaxID=2823700 RepID=UPI0020CB742B|nr:HEPN domain-containing protein [Cyanobium sp. ATX 6A2]MCP9888940.1 HEPN domain-containing protein [Cyanobium sp. ATX 6A2]